MSAWARRLRASPGRSVSDAATSRGGRRFRDGSSSRASGSPARHPVAAALAPRRVGARGRGPGRDHPRVAAVPLVARSRRRALLHADRRRRRRGDRRRAAGHGRRRDRVRGGSPRLLASVRQPAGRPPRRPRRARRVRRRRRRSRDPGRRSHPARRRPRRLTRPRRRGLRRGPAADRAGPARRRAAATRLARPRAARGADRGAARAPELEDELLANRPRSRGRCRTSCARSRWGSTRRSWPRAASGRRSRRWRGARPFRSSSTCGCPSGRRSASRSRRTTSSRSR